jgi:hypothetical protein
MKKFAALYAVLLACLSGAAQTTLTLQPNAAAGKDAELFSCYNSKNFGSIGENCAIVWTKSGADYKIRSLIEFDLSTIPAGSTIISATLSLFLAPGSDEGNHFGFFGSNTAWLQRVTSSWQENTVTWNNQPSTTATNRVSISGSTSGTQNYPKINVKTLVQDMINDPAHSFGFMVKLQTETVYKKLVFGSSDHSNEAIHPKLVVVYSSNPPLIETEDPNMQQTTSTQILNVFPNPAKEAVNLVINSSAADQAYISIYNLRGSEMTDQVYQLNEGKNQFKFETATWPKGIYMIIVKTGGEMLTEKLLLE